jgi:hypothetical protein
MKRCSIALVLLAAACSQSAALDPDNLSLPKTGYLPPGQCPNFPDHGAQPVTRDAALQCADAYFRAAGGGAQGTTRRIFDDGYQWIVSYHPPEGATGGGGIITVGKTGPFVSGIALGQ